MDKEEYIKLKCRAFIAGYSAVLTQENMHDEDSDAAYAAGQQAANDFEFWFSEHVGVKINDR